ncbi:MAG: transglutaminase domain-containing protein, partial [Candidatus Cloacimonadaceae bacterium]|nr:transglutaminase domain-containing protein [Candidatus Cloacimonadaceae bacterium]
SGRDQSPLDITQKTLLGRCEEMQILFVAACRTVGLPSRPASTPFWAHTDNNHAWAEVFLDGAWHYTGDMDNAYHPDQTWFSGLIDKTVLILADGSLPSVSDEVLVRGKYDSVINSTPNYTRERNRSIELSFIDEDGNSIPEVSIGVMVYNWSSLRPISYLKSDDKGSLTFSVGVGAFYLLAWKDSLVALQEIPAGSTEHRKVEIVLGKHLKASNVILDYPANHVEWLESPQSYKDEVSRIRGIWQKRVEDFAYSKTAISRDSLYLQVWQRCRNNKHAFDNFLQTNKLNPAKIQPFMQYLNTMDEKFLWQADQDQFSDLYHFYILVEKRLKGLGNREINSILSPSVHYEELPRPFYKGKKPNLYPGYFFVKGKNDLQRLQNVINMLHKRYSIDNPEAMPGLLRLDITANQDILNAHQFKTLACSALRANGFAAEYTRIPNVVNIYFQDKWQYFDLDKREFRDQPKDGDAEQITVKLHTLDENQNPINIDESNLLLSFYQQGGLYHYNTQFAYQDAGMYEVQLPAGTYLLQTGYRISDSQTWYLLLPFDVFSGSTEMALEIVTTKYPVQWKNIDSHLNAVVLELEKLDYEFAILGTYHQENTMRIAEELSKRARSFVIMGSEVLEKTGHPYLYSGAWTQLRRDAAHSATTITLRRTEEGKWQMYEGLWYQLPD